MSDYFPYTCVYPSAYRNAGYTKAVVPRAEMEDKTYRKGIEKHFNLRH